MTADAATDFTPVVPYTDIRAAHDFLVDVLGFESGGLVEANGSIVHGEVRAGGRAIWLHLAASGLSTPAQSGSSTAGIVVYVDDVDAHHEHARRHGATIERPPQDQDYGQREYGVRDPEGHRWFIATRL